MRIIVCFFFIILLLMPGNVVADAGASPASLPGIVIGAGPLPSSQIANGDRPAKPIPDLEQFLEHPEQWKNLRAYTNRLVYSDLQFKNVPDTDLQRWMQKMKSLGLSLEMESGVVKRWSTSGEKSFQIDSKEWNKIIEFGGTISSIAMDEPMPAALDQVKPPLPQDDAIEQIAIFVALVHKNYPSVKIGLINAYPRFSPAQTMEIVNKLQARLAQMGVRGLDFYRMDPNWIAFVIKAQPGSWEGMKQIQEYCDSIGLPFSLIYWASNYPRQVRLNGNIPDDRFWYDGLMQEAAGYASTSIRPDQYVIENWVGAPSQALPENNALSFAGSALSLLHQYYGPPHQ